MSDQIKLEDKKDETQKAEQKPEAVIHPPVVEAPKVEEKPLEPVKVEPAKPLPPHRYGTGTPVTVVKVESIKLPEWNAKEVETTGMTDGSTTWLPGVQDWGNGSIDVMYLAAQSGSLKALRNVPATFVVTYPNAQIDTFSGWITSLGTEIVIKDKIKQKIKVRATSDVVSSGTTTGTVPILGLGTTLTITSS